MPQGTLCTFDCHSVHGLHPPWLMRIIESPNGIYIGLLHDLSTRKMLLRLLEKLVRRCKALLNKFGGGIIFFLHFLPVKQLNS